MCYSIFFVWMCCHKNMAYPNRMYRTGATCCCGYKDSTITDKLKAWYKKNGIDLCCDWYKLFCSCDTCGLCYILQLYFAISAFLTVGWIWMIYTCCQINDIHEEEKEIENWFDAYNKTGGVEDPEKPVGRFIEGETQISVAELPSCYHTNQEIREAKAAREGIELPKIIIIRN